MHWGRVGTRLRSQHFNNNGETMSNWGRIWWNRVCVRQPCWRTKTIEDVCIKIEYISQRKIVVLFWSSNMAVVHTLYTSKITFCLDKISSVCWESPYSLSSFTLFRYKVHRLWNRTGRFGSISAQGLNDPGNLLSYRRTIVIPIVSLEQRLYA